MPQPKPAEAYRKNCTLCNKPRDVLVRCQIDEKTVIDPVAPVSQSESTSDSEDQPNSDSKQPTTTPPTLKPGAWHFVCPGSCWKRVSGGVIDGDLKEGREGYRYGGMWKNKHAGVSAKVPRRLKGKLGRESGGGGGGGEKREEREEAGGEEET